MIALIYSSSLCSTMSTYRPLSSLGKALLASSFSTAIASTLLFPQLSQAEPLQLAQATSLEPQTISVSGQGKATKAADRAALAFTFLSNAYPEYSEDGELSNLAEIAQPSDLQNIVEAIAAENLATDIEVTQEYLDYQYLQMVVKVEQPTPEILDRIKAVAAQAALANGQFSASPAGVIYATDSCESLRNTARDRAIEDAREQAIALAAASNLSLGNLTAIAGSTDVNFYGASELGCIDDLDEVINNIGPYGQYGYAGFGSYNAEVAVSFSVYATYRAEE